MVFLIEEGVLKACMLEKGETRIEIPAGITTIGRRAFDKCKGLQEVIVPEGLLSIGNTTFGWCSELTDITLPESLQPLVITFLSSAKV